MLLRSATKNTQTKRLKRLRVFAQEKTLYRNKENHVDMLDERLQWMMLKNDFEEQRTW